MFSPQRPALSVCSSSQASPLSLAYFCRGPALPPIQPLTPESSDSRCLATISSRPDILGKRHISPLRWLPASPSYEGEVAMGTTYEASSNPTLKPACEDRLPSTSCPQPQRPFHGFEPRLQSLRPPQVANLALQPLNTRPQQQHDRNSSTSTIQSILASSKIPLEYPYANYSAPTAPARNHISESGMDQESRRIRDNVLLHASSQTPAFIDSNRGSIADFAAQMTCLFWFESVETLRAAEKFPTWSTSTMVPLLTKHARPEDGFKRWVGNILSTTQVTQNVILLALCFIYKLKMYNPSVWGRPGSEYRLLTIALMLGNKFLDDNTYTNKTWAEVSCISVQEIHVMEVEFLSNMRYTLLVTREEWNDWLNKLSVFLKYCARSREPSVSQLHSSPILTAPAQPLNQAQPYSPLPSPTNLLPLTLSNAPFFQPQQPPTRQLRQSLPQLPLLRLNIPSVMPLNAPHTGNANALRPLHFSNVTSPLSLDSSPVPASRRKRSNMDDTFEHPAKRPARHAAVLPPLPSSATILRPASATPLLRLQVPNIALATNQVQGLYHTNASTLYLPQEAVSLPPLSHSVRAMSTVYATPSGATQLPCTATTNTHNEPNHSNIHSTSAGSGAPGGFRTPTKLRSPGQLSATFGSSPLSNSLGSSANAPLHTPVSYSTITHSPSIYLQNRASPYKPIRHVNTLLCPPKLTPVTEYPISVITPSQMYYQPLGRRYDLRTGIVPDFVMTPGRASDHQNHQPSQSRES